MEKVFTTEVDTSRMKSNRNLKNRVADNSLKDVVSRDGGIKVENIHSKGARALNDSIFMDMGHVDPGLVDKGLN